MNVMKIKNIQKSYGDKVVLNGVSFDIKENSRIGLVGYNGSGKTTLANIITGKTIHDDGSIEILKQLKIGYLFQSVEYEIIDYQKGVLELDNEEFLAAASQLGLKKIQQWSEDKYHHLSGGEKLKLVLAQIWNSKPEFLILDEPTNHLDIQGINWLIDELRRFTGPLIIISHDRYFLDQIANSILEIDDGVIHLYNGNYSEYQNEKQARINIQLQQFNEQEKYKQKIEAQIEQLSQWSEKAHNSSRKQEGFKEYHRVKAKKVDRQVKSKKKRLQKELEKNNITKPKDEPNLNFQFQMDGKKGKRVLEAKNIEKTFANALLFSKSHFYLKHSEKIGVIGPNGCGKTTLIKMILGDEALSSGDLWLSPTLKIAYLSQEALDLNLENSVLESFGTLNREKQLMARTYIANIGLPREIVSKKIGSLSMGERIRIKLVDMLIQEYDLIILDEPTNHLDLPSRERLEMTLKEYKGTIITVSHDYYFIDQICDTLLVFENKQIKRVEKTLNEYYNSEKNSTLQEQKLQDLMVIENRISQIIGEISNLTPIDSSYAELDRQFKVLLQRKRELLS